MPAEMFRPAPVARRRAWLLPLSIAAHGVVLAGVFIAPIMADAELPDPAHAAPIYVEVKIPPLPPAPRPPGEPREKPSSAAPANPDVAPLVAPDRIAPSREPAGPVEPGIPPGEGFGVPGVLISDGGGDFVEPAPPQKPLRVGGDILPPKKLRDVAPRYPTRRAAGADRGDGDHRSRDWRRRARAVGAVNAARAVSRGSGAGSGPPVGIHADPVERRGGAGGDDGDGGFSVAVTIAVADRRG